MQHAVDTSNFTEAQEIMFLSPAAQEMQIVMSNIKIDWNGNAANMLTYAQNNTDVLALLVLGDLYSSVAQLFELYGFPPAVGLGMRQNMSYT